MAKRLIKESILVVRNGKRVSPEIGKVFDLTDDEIKQLMRIRPQSIEKVGSVEVDEQSVDLDNAGDSDEGGDETDLDSMDRNDLLEKAKELGLTHAANISKAKLVELIKSTLDDDL